MSGDYQGYARAAALQKAIKDSVDKQYIDTPTVQRHVQEIYISPGYGQPGNGDEVKISMMVFAPSHDATNAGNVADDRPGLDRRQDSRRRGRGDAPSGPVQVRHDGRGHNGQRRNPLPEQRRLAAVDPGRHLQRPDRRRPGRALD